MWDLWWTKWYWDRFFSEVFGCLLSISFHRGSQTHIIWGMNNMSISGSSSETLSHPKKLFYVVMNEIVAKVRGQVRDINVMIYADDILIWEESEESLEREMSK
jgi:hypothetical protein